MELQVCTISNCLSAKLSDFRSLWPLSEQSPRSQLRKTSKVTQTSMFRTNKKALIFIFIFKILILSFKNNLHTF